MKSRSIVGSLAAGALLFAVPALAQVQAQEVAEKLHYNPEEVQVGVDVRVGLGGLTGNVGQDTGTGPLLGVTADAQVWPALGVEVGYEGQRIPINESLIGSSGEALYRHNVGLMGKAGPLLNDKWRPFVGTGVGLSYIHPTRGAFLYKNDIVEELPLAAGVDYNLGTIFAGARATYRVMFGESFADNVRPGGNNSGNLFNANLTLGGRF